MKYSLSALAISMLAFCSFPALAQAMDCYVDPVYQYSGTGSVSSAVFLRDQACSSGSNVLMTLSAGASVNVIGFTDGWYRIESNGARGWVGQQFITTNASQTDKSWSSYQDYMAKYPSQGATDFTPSPKPVTLDPNLLARLKGYILLQTQEHGEAWYVDPKSQKRYYMKDGTVAYGMMRSFGLGITDADLGKILVVDTTDAVKDATSICASNGTANRVKGRILLQVQQHGEAYYVYPKNCRMIYMKDGEAAYQIMRYLGLGITNTDLEKLPSE